MKFRKIFLVALFLAIIFVINYFNLFDFLSIENIKSKKDEFSVFYSNNLFATIISAFLIYIFSVIFYVPIASVLTVTFGYLFGFWVGTLLVVFAATIGAVINFLITKYLFFDYFKNKFENKLNIIASIFNKFGEMQSLFFLRLNPLFPFFILNSVLALVNVSFTKYFISTFLGIAPASAVYVYLGKGFAGVEKLGDLVSFELLIAFFVVSLFPFIINKFIKF